MITNLEQARDAAWQPARLADLRRYVVIDVVSRKWLSDGLVEVGHGERDVVGVPDAGDAGQLAAGARRHAGGPAVEARTSSSGVRTT